jgi:glycosyltransferase involved in cell wall biosynthesis
MKVLFTTPVLEHPPAGGPELRIENSIKALAQLSDVWIVSRLRQKLIGGPQATAFFGTLARRFCYSPSAALSENFVLRNIQKLYYRYLKPGADADYLIRLFDAEGMDVLWFGYGNISWPLIRTIKTRRPDIKVICDTDSVWSRFLLRELDVETNSGRRAEIERQGRAKEVEEADWTNLCEATLAVSEVDAEYYAGIARDPSRVHIFSNVIDLATYRLAPVAAAGLQSPSIYLAGTFGHVNSPMDRAARWILDDVLPLVRAEVPNVHLYIVGKNSDVTLSDARSSHVTVTGRLPSVLPYLFHVDVVLVPLKFESGTRFKILEAGACRKAVVSTILGAEGIPVTEGADMLLADDPRDFANAIVRLLRDPALRAQLGDKLHGLVQENYSVETLARQGAAILSSLTGSSVQVKS